MNKWELVLFGIVAIGALALMLCVSYKSITGAAVGDYELFNVGSDVFRVAPKNMPPLPQLPFHKANYTMDQLPPAEILAPQEVFFMVDRIAVPEVSYYSHMTLKKGSIHTYSGIAGYYYFDPTPYMSAYLCTYAYKITGAPLSCEEVPLAFRNGAVSFARGYAPDHYIAGQAAGTDFAALYVLANPEYGILAASPVAYLRWVKG
ncbi:MAG: hypothetical protein QXM31_00020 [Candidatus Woesearchaeota archaeon]